jgi:hypothetical protein
MIPFWNHPDFEKIDDSLRQRILTWAWINYNARTIHAEEKVANPAFALIMEGIYPGTDNFDMKSVVQQSLVDEHFHSLMHYNAIEATKKVRNLTETIDLPDSITYRHLVECQSTVGDDWQRKSMVLVWAIVSEISINAYLTLLSKNKAIQPTHSLIAKLHDIDEYAHASVLVEISKSIYVNFSSKEQEFFVRFLPMAMNAFCAQDYSMWKILLDHFKVPKAREIIQDCESDRSKKKIMRDFSGLKRVAEELCIINQLEYEF